MYKKLVKLDQYGSFTEIDPIEVRRTALALRAYIENQLSPADDEYGIREQALPLCLGVLEGTLGLPLDFYQLPLKYPHHEGLLPEAFSKCWSLFCIAVTGIAERLSEPVEIEGEKYCERIFEEPGDWPDKMARWEDERRRERMGYEYVPITR